MKRQHLEYVPADKYYGKHAVGGVVLANGQPAFHGRSMEAKAFMKEVVRRFNDNRKALG